jgi:hypothetical protein
MASVSRRWTERAPPTGGRVDVRVGARSDAQDVSVIVDVFVVRRRAGRYTVGGGTGPIRRRPAAQSGGAGPGPGEAPCSSSAASTVRPRGARR